MNKIYMCIDLKSFYASVECHERGLDPLNTNLVVADAERTEKTICLAVTPSLKAYGLGGRCRLFEATAKAKEINKIRLSKTSKHKFQRKSYIDSELKSNPDLELDFIKATPRMKLYMDYSTRIYNIYLKYLSKDDIYVYSIDEVFCDVTNYLSYYKMTPEELAIKIISDILATTGITATAGIGTNMYLAKVSMDIVAKHMEPDENGVRMASIDEMSYRKLLWNHRPLTDFWRVGKGIAEKLEKNHMYTMGDVCLMSLKNEDLLYKLFGVNAELLIDHAWGWEPCTIEDVKGYKPNSNSISVGQVLHCPYNYVKTKLIVTEMIEGLSLDLVAKHKVTSQLVLSIGYDIENLTIPKIRDNYHGPIVFDFYGRPIPKHAHGTININHKTSSTEVLTEKILELFDNIINMQLLVRRINIAACNIIDEDKVQEEIHYEQVDLFSNFEEEQQKREKQKKRESDEIKLQRTLLDIKTKYGKNAILKGMNLEEGGTAIDRNGQVGGHRG